MNRLDTEKAPPHPALAKVVIILVAITAVLSLFYGIQYYAGGPLRLPVISEIKSFALNPAKTLIAAGAEDGGIRLWELPRRLSTAIPANFEVAEAEPWPVRLLSGHKAPVIELAFSPDGSALTSVDRDGQVRIWDVAGGKVTREMLAGGGLLIDADLNDDASRLATVGADSMVRVWDLASGEEIHTSRPGDGSRESLAVALSSDGKLVAAGDGPDVQVWDLQTGGPGLMLAAVCEDAAFTTADDCEDADREWLGHQKAVTALAFSPENDLIASGSADTTLVFWDVEKGEWAFGSEGAWAAITTVTFSQQGNSLLAGGRDFKIRDFRVPGGKVSATFEGHLTNVNGVAYGPVNGAILSAGDDGTLRLWETANQYVLHLEWSRLGLQPVWGRLLGQWMLISGLLGLVAAVGLWRNWRWSHLLALALFLLGPIVVLGLPLLETLSYPLVRNLKLQIAWPLIALLAWYTVLLVLLARRSVALHYEAPHAAPLAEQLAASQRTVRLRVGIYALAVWILLLVVLYSLLRRFNLDIAFMGHFFSFIMQGAWITLRVSALSILLAVVLALLGALGRLSKNPIASGASGFYISLIRGTPLLVQIYIWYLGLPRLGIVLAGELAGILALGVNYGAYMTEIFRAGIQAIGKGQHEAAQALGMSRGQTFRRIVLPQAFRIVIPPIGNEFIAMMKDSSLVSVMSIWELTYRAQKIGRQNFRNMETFIIAAAFYWLLTVVFQFLQGKLEEHMARSERR